MLRPPFLKFLDPPLPILAKFRRNDAELAFQDGVRIVKMGYCDPSPTVFAIPRCGLPVSLVLHLNR